jgi:hypothetical protein
MNWKTALEGHDSVPEEQRWRCACCDWDHPISLNRLPGHLPLDKFPKRAHNSISAELLPWNLRFLLIVRWFSVRWKLNSMPFRRDSSHADLCRRDL